MWHRADLLTAKGSGSQGFSWKVQKASAESFPLHLFLYFVISGRALSLNMLQRTLGLGELSVLELVVRFCSVNELSGIAVISPGTH